MRGVFIKRRFFITVKVYIEVYTSASIYLSSCLNSKYIKNLIMKLFPLEYVFTYSITSMQQGNYKIVQKQIKCSSKENARNVLESYTNEKRFPKIIGQLGFLFTKSPRTLIVCNISPSSFKLERGILPPMTKQIV